MFFPGNGMEAGERENVRNFFFYRLNFVICIIYSVFLYSVSYILYSVLCILYSVLCIMFSVFGFISYIICIIACICILCPVSCLRYPPVSCVLYFISCILYHMFCILYPVFIMFPRTVEYESPLLQIGRMFIIQTQTFVFLINFHVRKNTFYSGRVKNVYKYI